MLLSKYLYKISLSDKALHKHTYIRLSYKQTFNKDAFNIIRDVALLQNVNLTLGTKSEQKKNELM